MKKTILSLLVAVAISAFANKATAQISYDLNPQSVTVTLVDHEVIPVVKDINQDTGLPDGTLPLVTDASWTTYDSNSNPTADNHLTGAKAATRKLGNAEILASLVPDVIPSVKGYALVLTGDSSGGDISAYNAKTGDLQSTGYTWSANLLPLSYSSSDITTYKSDGTVKAMTHKATSSLEGKVTLSGGSIDGELTGVATSSSTDFSWIATTGDPTSLQWITVPGAVKVTGIIGSEPWGDVIDGSVTVAAASTVKIISQ
jgi:hypothetical protein